MTAPQIGRELAAERARDFLRAAERDRATRAMVLPPAPRRRRARRSGRLAHALAALRQF